MPVSIRTDKLRQSILKDSYEAYVEWAWPIIVNDPLIWNWHMTEICSRIETAVKRVVQRLPCEKDLLVNICPGSSKSLLTSILLPGWSWINDPTLRFICGSYALDLSLDLSRKSRMVIKSAEYRAMFPDIEISSIQDSKSHFVNTRGGERVACAAGGNIIGKHAHIIILDDPIDPKMASSEQTVIGVNKWIAEEINQRKASKTVTLTMLIMQRLAQNDPAGKWIETRSNRIDRLTIPASDDFPVYPPKLRKYYKKGLMDPVRVPRNFLEAVKEENDYIWSGQFGQQPVPPGGGQFTIDKFRKDTENAPTCVKFVRAWDKAGSMSKGSAWTVGVLMGVDPHNRFRIYDVIRTKLRSFERDLMIKSTAEKDGMDCWIAFEQEPGSGGKQSLDFSLRDLSGYKIKWTKPKKDKEERAQPYATQVNGGNVWLNNAHWTEKFIEEHRYFPVGTYKDQVDAAAMAFDFLAGPSSVRIGGFTSSESYKTGSFSKGKATAMKPSMDTEYLQSRMNWQDGTNVGRKRPKTVKKPGGFVVPKPLKAPAYLRKKEDVRVVVRFKV